MTGDREPLFSATLMLDQLEIMRELYGDACIDGALGGLPADVREEVDRLARGGWCKVSTSAAVKKEVARSLGDGPLHLQRAVVKLATERSLRGVWRFFLPRLSDSWLLRFSPLLYSKAFDYGALVVDRIVDGRAEVAVRGWAQMPDFDCLGIATAIETILALGNRADPKVTWMRRGDEVKFVGVWRVALTQSL